MSPEIAQQSLPTPRARTWKKSRQEYAAARRERLVLLLSARDVEAFIAAQIADGVEHPEQPCPLGYGRCAKCRRTLSADWLEIDHQDGCTWDKRAVNAWRRVARYWRELAEGVRLRVLCRSCNGSDGYRFRGRKR